MNEVMYVWQKFKDTGNIEYKNKLIEKYIYLVKIVSGRLYNYYNGNVDFDDLLGFGIFGLIDAIEKFDISRNIKFESYAQIRIRGAIIDNLRKLDWIPRSLRKKSKLVEDAIEKLEIKGIRNITTKDISTELSISEDDVNKTLNEISTFNITSLDELLIKSEPKINNQFESPEDIYERKEITKILSKTIELLSQKEKLVISLYYYEELTYKEISEILNVSESRISQIHSKATLFIKNKLMKFGISGYN